MKVNYDQHFLENDEILDFIVNSLEISSKNIIFEVGPGKLSLTKKILEKKPKKLVSCEIDERFGEKLENLKGSNFDYYLANCLDVIEDINFDKLTGNIPYSLSEPLFKKILKKKIEFAVLLLGRRFYERVIFNEESKLGIFIRCFYDVELVKIICGKEFEPITKVKSVVLRLELKKDLSENEKFLQVWFSKYDRSLKNSLVFSFVDFFSISKRQAKEKLDSLKIREGLLSQKLDFVSNEDFLKVLKSLFN